LPEERFRQPFFIDGEPLVHSSRHRLFRDGLLWLGREQERPGRKWFHMALTRFSVSLDEDLVRRFDASIRSNRYPSRSKAVGDLIRSSLVEEEWQAGKEVAGAIVLAYDHHKSDIVQRLTAVQHDHGAQIISTQHIHLDHDNCLEIIAVRGMPDDLSELIRGLKAVKGLKHVSVAAGTTGTDLT
jgi:CopG family nickel-responsive transcriptional regulator